MRDIVRQLLTGIVTSAMGLLVLQPAAAQQSVVTGYQAVATSQPGSSVAKPAPAPPTREQVEHYISLARKELERSEARVTSLRSQLVALDGDIESRVERVVSLLSSMRDSSDTSSRRIRKAKEDALAGLEATAKYYAQERDRRKKEMGNRYALIEDDELARNVAALNARIETRATQSLAIAKSLVQHQEGQTGRYRDNDTNYSQETDEYKRTRRDAQSSIKVKTDVVATLRASIDKLTRDVDAREAELRTTSDPQRKEQLAEDIQTMRKTIDARRSQVEELLRAPAPNTRPVVSEAAFELDKMLDEMTVELKKDYMAFKRLVGEFDTARARLKPLRTRLEKAEAMLNSMSDESPADAGK